MIEAAEGARQTGAAVETVSDALWLLKEIGNAMYFVRFMQVQNAQHETKNNPNWSPIYGEWNCD